MIVLRNRQTNELVGVNSTGGYAPAEWHDHGAFDPDVVAYLKWQDAGIVEDYTILEAPLHARIDREAGEVRGRFVTVAPGQAETYLAKRAEADGLLAGSPAATPHLTAEAAVRGISVTAMAALIAQKSAEWAALGARIEAARIGAKLAVSAAATAVEKTQAATMDWNAVIAGD